MCLTLISVCQCVTARSIYSISGEGFGAREEKPFPRRSSGYLDMSVCTRGGADGDVHVYTYTVRDREVNSERGFS